MVEPRFGAFSMDPRDLKEVDTLLGIVGKASLFEYYEVDPHSEDDFLDQAIKKRRSWAQGQQANPKFRNEALWLIKHNALVRRVLVDHRGEYLREVENRVQEHGLKELKKYIRVALASGKLSPESEEALREQGLSMGLHDDAITQLIDEMLDETGISRDDSVDEAAPLPTSRPPGASGPFVDYYALLGVEATATPEKIELAHREKYREARNRRDKERASEMYAQLDEAWRVLHDATKRAEYDVEHRARGGGQGAAAKGADIEFFLPPPPDAVQAPTAQSAPAAPPIPRPEPPPVARPAPPEPPGLQRLNLPPIPVPTHGEANGEVPPTRAVAPPKPPPITRTIGMSPQQRTRSRPRLSIASPDLVVIKVGRKPVSHSFVVKNSGQGKMPGRITSDREWVQVSRSRLDPDASQQEVEVVIHPRMMPRNTGVALVTVVTDHGERRAITLRVERTAVPLPYLAGALLFVAVVAAIAAAIIGITRNKTKASPPSGAALEILIDPTSDSVRVNSVAVGQGERVRVDDDLEDGETVTVAAVLDGFEMAEQRVEIKAGETQTVRLELKLRDTFAKPGPGLTEAQVDAELADKALSVRKKGIEKCFQSSLSDRPGLEARMNADIYFNSLGSLIYVDIREANFNKDAMLPCLQRPLRAGKFPAVGGGDYSVVRGRTFAATVTSGSG